MILETNPSLLGESPFWHPNERKLYWCDILGKKIFRFDPASKAEESWSLPQEPGCIAPIKEGGLIVGMRDGIYSFIPTNQELELLYSSPFNSSKERFNDGKCDALGRLWLGSIYEPKTFENACLYSFQKNGPGFSLNKMARENITSNGLAFSPNNQLLYWAHTSKHRIDCYDFYPKTGLISNRRLYKQFPLKGEEAIYQGRPDGACIDVEGCYWVAMYEGGKVIKISPSAEVIQEIHLPTKYPTMPCLGGVNGKTLFITTAAPKNVQSIEADPLAGKIFVTEVDTPGIPVNFFG